MMCMSTGGDSVVCLTHRLNPLNTHLLCPPPHPTPQILQRMREGEVEHRDTLARVMAERRVRPTVFEPLVHAAGFALGAVTAVLGKEAAMACTVAVETVIGDHYNDQIRTLLASGYGYRETELAAILKKNRDDELDHLETGLRHGAESAPAYKALVGAVKAGCSAGIWLAKRY